MNATQIRAAVLAALATLALAGCQREPGDATVGQKLDNAIDRTQAKLAVAGEATSQAVADAGEKASHKIEEVGGKAQAAMANAADKIAEKTGQVAVAVQEASVSPAVSDTAITASIKTDFFKDPDLRVLKIDVDTKVGVVTLNGLASDEAARLRAGKMASAVKGVKEVRNFLVVKRA